MIVYHGSDSNFRKLRIAKSLVKHSTTLDNEGMGIYFSTDMGVAQSYGRYIYVLEINDNYFLDFRESRVCYNYLCMMVSYVKASYGVDLSRYFNMRETSLRMADGWQRISRTCHEVYMLLDSNADWYADYNNTLIQKIYKFLESYDKKHLFVYMFEYHIHNIGVIKTTDENVVRIVEKINRSSL